MGENIKNGRRYLILGQNSISSPIFNILPHYEKLGVRYKKKIHQDLGLPWFIFGRDSNPSLYQILPFNIHLLC
jgi:hypothetical protein